MRASTPQVDTYLQSTLFQIPFLPSSHWRCLYRFGNRNIKHVGLNYFQFCYSQYLLYPLQFGHYIVGDSSSKPQPISYNQLCHLVHIECIASFHLLTFSLITHKHWKPPIIEQPSHLTQDQTSVDLSPPMQTLITQYKFFFQTQELATSSSPRPQHHITS